MAFFALTPRSFPLELPHPNDPAIDWLETAKKMGLYEEPEGEVKEGKARDALIDIAKKHAKVRYRKDFNAEQIAYKEGETPHLFTIRVVPHQKLQERDVLEASAASRREDGNDIPRQKAIFFWVYNNYVTPPGGVGFPLSYEEDMGQIAYALSITSVSEKPEDDTGK